MTTDLATRVPAQLPEAVEQALVNGDLSAMSPKERVQLYLKVCESLHLNPLTVPFQYLELNKRLVLYALKSCTDQLRFIHNVNVEIVSRERIDDIYVVTTRATLPNGRTDEEIGAVPIAGLKGETLANALMKASTKAKRRVTLAIVGLSMLDETEVDSIRDARQPKFQVMVDPTRKQIFEQSEPDSAPAPGRTQLEQREVEQLLDSLEHDYQDATGKRDLLDLQDSLEAFWNRLTAEEQVNIDTWKKAAVARLKAAVAPDPEPEPVRPDPLERPDRKWCRTVGLHLPRTIAPHPTNPMMTLERCLRCGCVIHRSRLTGKEVEVSTYRIGSEKVTVR